jgi:hypothetical protein
MAQAADAGSYLLDLSGRIGEVLGGRLVGVYAGGSWALGDYLPGRSDLDVAVVFGAALEDEAAAGLAAATRHESLACPARGLELVVYTAVVAASGTAKPGFELNLNTGAAIETRIDRDPAVDDAHWFAIDRAILAQRGLALRGPAAAEVFLPPPRDVLLELLRASIRWQEERAERLDDAVLGACRAAHYARTGLWASKTAAGEWAREGLGDAALIEAALAVRGAPGGEGLDPAAARPFLAAVRRTLR